MHDTINWSAGFWIIIGCLALLRVQHYINNQTHIEQHFIGRSELIVFIGLMIFGLIGPIIIYHSYTNWSYHVPIWGRYIGIILLIVAIYVLSTTLHALDRQDSTTLQIRDQHQLVQTGPYRYVRHPMYSGLLLIILAQICLAPNLLGIGSTLIAFLFLLIFRIPPEERMLQQTFGTQYQDYQRSTCGLVPSVCHWAI